MKKKGRKPAVSKHSLSQADYEDTSLAFHKEILQQKKQIEKIWETVRGLEERMQDAEIHVNLLTRLLTALCIEKFGIRIGVLKRLIKRIEKEAIRDSQISQLESLYKLPHRPPSMPNQVPRPPSKEDPWEEIS